MENSRQSEAGAGWTSPPQDLAALMPPALRGSPPLSWLRPRTLIGARNDVLARAFGDPAPEQRELWLRQLHPGVPAERRDLTVDRSDLTTGSDRGDQPDRPDFSFIVMGDPGEGDPSQYAVLSALDRWGAATDFMVICSDVIYPAGDPAEYAYKFHWPYDRYPGPIYGLPGNHDWYDDLAGFMAQFYGATSVPPRPRRSLWTRTGLRDRLWRTRRRPATADEREVLATRRAQPEQQVRIPGPYYRITTGVLDLVLIDTGIDGTIDADQGRWLRQVSRSPRPKVLLTGKPLYADGEHHPCPIDHGRDGTVDEIVRDPVHRYVAAIGGDTHNYQRYPVDVGGRTIQYVVSGGGGAFMHATHQIPDLDTCGLPGVTEADFRCFPLRGDSLAFYSRLYDKRFPGDWAVPPDQAAAYLSERLRVPATRPGSRGVVLTAENRRRAERVFPRPGRVKAPWHMAFSEFFDGNDPPLFKHFLRLDVTGAAGGDDGTLSLTCHSALGCVDDAEREPEDRVAYDLGSDTWSRPGTRSGPVATAGRLPVGPPDLEVHR